VGADDLWCSGDGSNVRGLFPFTLAARAAAPSVEFAEVRSGEAKVWLLETSKPRYRMGQPHKLAARHRHPDHTSTDPRQPHHHFEVSMAFHDDQSKVYCNAQFFDDMPADLEACLLLAESYTGMQILQISPEQERAGQMTLN